MNWREKDKNYQQEKQKYPNPVPSRDYILQVLAENKKSYSFIALAKLFELNRAEKETLNHRLKAMIRDFQIEETNKKKYRAVTGLDTVIGKVIVHPDGYGFLSVVGEKDDYYLNNREVKSVMHQDIAEAVVFSNKSSKKKEVKIIKVIEHANKIVVGKLIDDYGFLYIKPESPRLLHKIKVTNLDDFQVKPNQMLEVEITEYPRYNRPIVGKVLRVIGDYMDAGMEIEVAIANHGLPNQWSNEVVEETIAIADVLSEHDYKDRVDLRKLPFVTIDGISARDFDDAVYAKKTNKGYKIYVAIADVAHYVEKDSPLDIEARQRSTSVYFPNRVIPMLPEKLSNGLCSLNPSVDRLCLTCEILIDNEGNILRSKFYDAVIHSHARLTYELVEELLFNNNIILQKENKEILPDLKTLKAAYLILRKQRDRRGAINFRTTEPEFEFDAQGKISHIFARENLKSNQLIEEFMVRANVCAAKFLLRQKGENKPIALFRNHQGPNGSKLEQLVEILVKYGIEIKGDLKNQEEVTAKQISEVMDKISGRDDFEYLQTQVLRSMSQATYGADNIGHFGLSLEHYAHFTSPIRRYPDLLVHRAIKYANRYKGELYIYSKDQMDELGSHCSVCERRADDASYDVIGFLKCEYMQDKIGNTYKAKITTVTNFGLFIAIDDDFIDGLVHISTLDGDYFNYDDQSNRLIGERTGISYKIGDPVEIQVVKVNIDTRKIDFILTDDYLPQSKKRKPKKSSSKKTDSKKADSKKSGSKRANSKKTDLKESGAKESPKPKRRRKRS